MTTEIKYGLITGFSVCGWMLLQFFLGFHTTHLEYGSVANQLSLLILIIGWYLMLRAKREKDFGGALSFNQGFKAGVVASSITAAIITVFSQLYNRVINPGWTQRAYEWQMARLRDSGTSEADLAQLRQSYEASIHAPLVSQILSGLVGSAVMGIVIAAIICVMMRRPAKTSAAPAA